MSTTAPRRRIGAGARRTIVAVVLTITTVALIAVVADSLVAAKVERSISQRIYQESQLATPPAVQVTGMPYLAATWNHELPSVKVEARDVEIPGFTRVSVTSSASKVTLTREEVLSGNFTNAPARQVFTKIQLDGVSLGDIMIGADGASPEGLQDLHIEGVENISPSGGWETEAYFTATPAGETEPVKVAMWLRVWEGDVRLLPTKIISIGGNTARGDGKSKALDEDARKKIMAAFTLELPATSLPLRTHPGRVYVNGGALYIESEQNFTRVSTTDLAPRSASLGEDDRAGL